MTDDAETADAQHRLGEALQEYGSLFNRYGRRFAQWAGLHSTDGEALSEIVYAERRGEPLSPSRLAERVQLTSGATTSLIDRLERQGYVIRSREATDRRTVTLRGGEAVHQMADEYFGPLGRSVDDVLSAHSPELLSQFEELLVSLVGTLNAQLDRQPPRRTD